jgi:hypothetical protein
MSARKLMNRYFSLLIKIWVSHSDLACYAFMMLATIETGGFLYLVYPIMIFGKALVHENRPGKTFWAIVLIFT